MAELENKIQYDWAVSRVESLLPLVDEDTPATDSNRIELELLSNLVADYSDEHFDIGEPDFLTTLRSRLSERHLSQKDAAVLIGISPSKLSEILNGKVQPTLNQAKTISREFDILPSLILGL